MDKVEDLLDVFNTLSYHCETLATEKLVPDLLTPIARYITTGPA